MLAVWSLTGAMKTLMWALNIAHDAPERRGFFRTRIAAIAMLACIGTAFVLVFALLVLGPQLSDWVGAALEVSVGVGLGLGVTTGSAWHWELDAAAALAT